MSYNIIGDIAGQIKTLEALLKKMPQGQVISVGDMIDRGPNSKAVLDFFMNNPNARAIMGNHEHMMWSCLLKTGHYYSAKVWFDNGGGPTVTSFIDPSIDLNDPKVSNNPEVPNAAIKLIKEKYLPWIEKLPLYIELPAREDGLIGFVSHAPKSSNLSLVEACNLDSTLTNQSYSYDPIDDTIIWYRGHVYPIEGQYQIFGHNSHWGHCILNDAMCIDSSRSDVLTGVHWPSMEVFQQDYID